jgi:hypothetical protein
VKLRHQGLDEVFFDEDVVGAGFSDCFVDLWGLVCRQGDETERRMVSAEAGDRGDAVEERHVEVHHDGVGVELLDELDGVQAVLGCAGDAELRLRLDQDSQRGDESLIVVRDQDPDWGRSKRG